MRLFACRHKSASTVDRDLYKMKVSRIDHLVLTVTCIETTCRFYERSLGMETIEFGDNRKALRFGCYKFNLHQLGHEYEPKAALPTPGSADLCLIADSAAGEIEAHMKSQKIVIERGPVTRTGANGPITSFYIRDPDKNLIEISTYNDH